MAEFEMNDNLNLLSDNTDVDTKTIEQLSDEINTADYTKKDSWLTLSFIIRDISIDNFKSMITNYMSDLMLYRILSVFSFIVVDFTEKDNTITEGNVSDGEYLTSANAAKNSNERALLVDYECNRRHMDAQRTIDIYKCIYKHEISVAFTDIALEK